MELFLTIDRAVIVLAVPTNNMPVPLIHFRTMDLMARILNGSLTRAVAVISGRSLDGLRG